MRKSQGDIRNIAANSENMAGREAATGRELPARANQSSSSRGCSRCGCCPDLPATCGNQNLTLLATRIKKISSKRQFRAFHSNRNPLLFLIRQSQNSRQHNTMSLEPADALRLGGRMPPPPGNPAAMGDTPHCGTHIRPLCNCLKVPPTRQRGHLEGREVRTIRPATVPDSWR
jgi:hypothetical protein